MMALINLSFTERSDPPNLLRANVLKVYDSYTRKQCCKGFLLNSEALLNKNSLVGINVNLRVRFMVLVGGRSCVWCIRHFFLGSWQDWAPCPSRTGFLSALVHRSSIQRKEMESVSVRLETAVLLSSFSDLSMCVRARVRAHCKFLSLCSYVCMHQHLRCLIRATPFSVLLAY